MLRLVLRFAVGHHLHGRRKTNARWTTRGTELRDGHEHAGWWAHQSLRRRASLRWLALAWLVVHAYWLVRAGVQPIVITLRVEFAITAALGVWWTLHRYRKYAMREYASQIGMYVADWLGYSRHMDPLELVKLPMGFRTNPDKPIEITFPKGHVETDRRQKQVAAGIASHAGIKSHDYELLVGEGDAPKMLVRAQLVPPDEIVWAEDVEFQEALRANTDDSKLLLGRGLHDEFTRIDLALDSPHMAGSMGSGAGKSTFGRFLGSQVVYQGGRCAIFDGGKDGESHQDWARDEYMQLTPGVEFYPSIAEEHDALIAWEAERQRRAQAVLARTGENFQRTLLILEERNITMPKLAAYWASIREPGDPVKSPAIQAIANLVAAGRSVKMNVLAFAQRFDAATIGGGAVRSSFQLRVLARFDEQARKMLIPEVTPKPKSSNHPGRALLCVSGEAHPVQLPYMTAAEAIELCRAAKPQADDRIIAPRPKNPALATEPTASLGQTESLGLVQAQPKRTLLTLNEAWQQGIVSGALEGVRSAAKRGKGFPVHREEAPGGAYLYDASELAGWEADRQLRGSARMKVEA